MTLLKRFTLTALAALYLALVAPPAMAAEEPRGNPLELARETSAEMLDALSDRRQELLEQPQRIYGLVEEIILPRFDFELTARWVLGRWWPKATPEQRQRFIEEFRDLLVRTYASALLSYENQDIEFKPLRSRSGSDKVTVRSVVRQPGGSVTIPVDYVMRHRPEDGWKVFDMVIDGVSLIQNYRSSVSARVNALGLDGMIDELARRNRQGESS